MRDLYAPTWTDVVEKKQGNKYICLGCKHNHWITLAALGEWDEERCKKGLMMNQDDCKKRKPKL